MHEAVCPRRKKERKEIRKEEGREERCFARRGSSFSRELCAKVAPHADREDIRQII
jgi:hypothetical protein